MKKNYKSQLSLFVKQIKEMNKPAFVNPEKWTLCDSIENGVSVASVIADESDRKLLHEIGQHYGLIPLCPNEVVDLDFLKDGQINFAVVKTVFGKLKIEH